MIKQALACTLLLGSVIATPASADDDRNVLFRFDGGIGSQPLRAGPVANAVAGVAPGGAPWPIKSLKAVIGTEGQIRIAVKGILLGGTDNIGSRGGPRKMIVSLFCRNAPVAPAITGTLQTVPYDSGGVDLDPDGNFRLESVLTNASGATPPADCGDTVDNRPVLLIRTAAGTPLVAGSWFAAGILKAGSDD